eukprot:6202660-Pleurochrysis_carterae.AAC.3
MTAALPMLPALAVAAVAGTANVDMHRAWGVKRLGPHLVPLTAEVFAAGANGRPHASSNILLRLVLRQQGTTRKVVNKKARFQPKNARAAIPAATPETS